MGSFDVTLDEERTQLRAFIEEYRNMIELTLDRLTEEQARRRLVPSATTSLGLLKRHLDATGLVRGVRRRHVAPGTRPGADPGRVLSARRRRHHPLRSPRPIDRRVRRRAAVAELPLDAVTGHRAGPRTVRWVYFQVLRELAHHCGHADICANEYLPAEDPRCAEPSKAK